VDLVQVSATGVVSAHLVFSLKFATPDRVGRRSLPDSVVAGAKMTLLAALCIAMLWIAN
jgi:hypothetical protein